MSDLKKARQLLTLLEVKYNRDQAALASEKQKAKAIEDEIELLRNRLADRTDFTDNYEVQIFEKHALWISQEISALNINLASAMVRMNEAEAGLRRSFGRWRAFEMVLAKQEAAK